MLVSLFPTVLKFIIQKIKKGNFIIIVDRDKYIKNMENFLSDQSKFQKAGLKDEKFLNFAISQEKPINKIYKKKTSDTSRN